MVGCASTHTYNTPSYNLGSGEWSHKVSCDQGRFFVILKNDQKESKQGERDQACADVLPQARRDLEPQPHTQNVLIIQQPMFNQYVCASRSSNISFFGLGGGRSWNGFVWANINNGGGCGNGLSPYLYGQNGFVNYYPPPQPVIRRCPPVWGCR